MGQILATGACRAVFFDAVGTLIHPDPPAIDVYCQVGRCHGSQHSREEMSRRFHEAIHREDEQDRAAGWTTSEEREFLRWRAIVGATLNDADDPDMCFSALYRHFALPESWRLESRFEPIMDNLRQRSIVVGIASNFDARLRTVLAGWQSLKQCNPVVISSEVGYRKPAARFFQYLVDLTGLPPASILYVGDDPTNDVLGAQAAGLRAILPDECAA